jgi:E3 ubiquitin-protein ligase XBAT32/33
VQVNRADYLNGRTALHFAAVSGHARCIRLIVADYLPSVPHLWNTLNTDESASMKSYPDQRLFVETIFQLATSLQMYSSS